MPLPQDLRYNPDYSSRENLNSHTNSQSMNNLVNSIHPSVQNDKVSLSEY